MTWRQSIVEEALTWRGTPFHHKSRIKGVGVDCGGFIYELYNGIGVPLAPFPKHYAQDWALHRGDEIYLEFLQPYVAKTLSLQPADIIVFQVGRAYSHGTLYLGNNQIIHAWGKTGFGSVKINSLRHPEFAKRSKKLFTLGEQWHSLF